MTATKALIDTNIIIDALTNREPFSQNSNKIILKCAQGNLEGFIASHTVTNLFYVLRKNYSTDERRKMLKIICTIFCIIPVDEQILLSAITDETFGDFEDCVQYYCALKQNCGSIITRDKTGFKSSQIPVYFPEDLHLD